MNTIKLKIDNKILEKYPDVKIGYILVSNLKKINNSLSLKSLESLPIQGINRYNLELQNLPDFSTISKWREVYRDCDVKPKTYKSSIESLLRRFIQGKYNPIIPSVDFYNYISARYILSAGGYDYTKIENSLTLRYAKSSDKFIPLGNSKNIEIQTSHIVYADENDNDPIVCWLWNHKDSKRTMLTETVDKALFIFDSIDFEGNKRLLDMIDFFCNSIQKSDVKIEAKGIIEKNKSEAIL
ncbi:hypothetical protein GCM10011344_27540 [Dokdonia pacifica]|uniref:B3/B4 domain-containing protein (DNA/RNA-binding domain of Phe-tRNA-synthetase) n=1 Tax=Dokdonia pacifica TaxID=1627892 RepID=A0A239CEL5_9FLAO|nr:phenylalanine--tRNA ligase beta subunit-related protein [Dokdonia pacifica]GGG25350.1 hypothetical protein GCM10011344_27540 [Dokdonia pacifica]SNS18675.1 B3/B4 domain-containing protein (DNA/RNA-binding domain of Phe-tRNA-synthetase) [Dokdonia pacifica]